MASKVLHWSNGERATLSVDPVTDAAYLYVRDRQVAKTVQVSDEVNVDFDRRGNVVGVEILRSKK